MCVQNFDDSRGPAIRITYRISLRSSSLWDPRHPLLKVVLDFFDKLARRLLAGFGVLHKASKLQRKSIGTIKGHAPDFETSRRNSVIRGLIKSQQKSIGTIKGPRSGFRKIAMQFSHQGATKERSKRQRQQRPFRSRAHSECHRTHLSYQSCAALNAVHRNFQLPGHTRSLKRASRFPLTLAQLLMQCNAIFSYLATHISQRRFSKATCT